MCAVSVYPNLKVAVTEYAAIGTALEASAHLFGAANDDRFVFGELYAAIDAYYRGLRESGRLDQAQIDRAIEAVAFLLVTYTIADTVTQVNALDHGIPDVQLIVANPDGSVVENPDVDADPCSVTAGRMIAAMLADDLDGARAIYRAHLTLGLRNTFRLIAGLALISANRPRSMWDRRAEETQ